MSASKRKSSPRQTAAQKKRPRKRATRMKQGRRLVIVESPAKAETIGRFLGDEYYVDSSYGHVRDLPRSADERPDSLRGKSWADLAVDVEQDFEPAYIVPAEKQQHVDRLKKALRQADKLLLATDEDREGESISWHLLELLRPNVPVERIVFHEVTPEAISEALESPREVDRNLVAAQESRRILDRLFGYSLSPVLWRKVQAGLSAGRVQSVAVRLLVQRERERAAFHRAQYWDLDASVEAAEGRCAATLRRLGDARMPTGRDFDSTTGALQSDGVRVLSEAECRGLIPALRTQAWTVSRVEASPATKRPAAPFTTSTLQQEANRKLGYGASRTMQIAQRLYEGIDMGAEREGLITYMRTDSVTLSERALAEAQTVLRERFGAEFATGSRRYTTKTRNAQEAHEAIRPTQLQRAPSSLRSALPRDALRLYELIWQRTLASQMPDAKLERTVIEITAPLDEGPAVFEARGRRILFPGYLRAYVEGSDEPGAESDDSEQPLPALQVGESVRPLTLDAKRHETQPPARYTEASLVKKLEEEGLGRPSTYAAIIGTIQDRGYVFRLGNALAPTFLAYAVTQLLERHFGDLVEPRFTAQMEDTLDAIARGETDTVTHLRRFYHGDDGEPGLVPRIDAEIPTIAFPLLPVGDDPESGQPIVVRIGRFGPYLQRGSGEDAATASLPPELPPAELTLDKAAEMLAAKLEGPRVLGHDPETGLEVLLQTGRYGPYVQLGPIPPAAKKGKGAKGKSQEQPRRAAVPSGTEIDTVTIEDALIWLSLPRTLGVHPDSGDDVIAASGRYGPYVQSGKESRSLGDEDDVYSIGLERAVEVLAQPKSASFRRRASKVLRDLARHPESAAPLRVLDGPYGPYVSDGKINAKIPPGLEPASLTVEQAVELIAERAAAPPRPRRGSTGKRAAAKRGGARTGRARKTKAKTKSA